MDLQEPKNVAIAAGLGLLVAGIAVYWMIESDDGGHEDEIYTEDAAFLGRISGRGLLRRTREKAPGLNEGIGNIQKIKKNVGEFVSGAACYIFNRKPTGNEHPEGCLH